jgi:hypothetical protein
LDLHLQLLPGDLVYLCMRHVMCRPL